MFANIFLRTERLIPAFKVHDFIQASSLFIYFQILYQMELSKVRGLVRDLPVGPLQRYRERATFNWKLLKLNLEGEAVLRYKVSPGMDAPSLAIGCSYH